MAALDKLKKADLVKLARELKQENKLLKKEVENVTTQNVDESKLPLTAVTCYKKADGDFRLDILKYCPDNSNVKVVKSVSETTRELALFKLEMVIAEDIMQQELKNEQ